MTDVEIVEKMLKDMELFDLEFINVPKELLKIMYEALKINQCRLERMDNYTKEMNQYEYKSGMYRYWRDLIETLEECE